MQGRELREARREIGMVFQEYNLVERLSVMENLLSGRLGYVPAFKAWLRRFPAEDVDRAFALLDKVGLAGYANQRADALSGGQRQRVGIARGMANNPKIMLYDEPTSGLDPLTTGTITNLIIKLQRELGVTSVVVTHDIRSAFRMASRIAVLARRKICFFGTPEEMSGSDDKYLRDFLGGF